MSNEHTLFLQFDPDNWTANELERLVNAVSEVIPEDCGAVALPQDVECLTEEQVRDIVDTLADQLEDAE